MNREQRRRAGRPPSAAPVATVHVTGTHDGDRERLAVFTMFDEWYCGFCGVECHDEPFGYSTVGDDPRLGPLCKSCTLALGC